MLFISRISGTKREEKFGSIQADPFSPGIARCRKVVRKLNVCVETDHHPVRGCYRPAPLPLGAGQRLRLVTMARNTAEDLRRRFNNDTAVCASHNDDPP